MAVFTFMGHFLKALGRRKLIGLPSSSEPTKAEIYELVYPVGSYYETSDTTFDPAVAGWFGTWVEETDSRSLVAKSGAQALNDTGGGAHENRQPYILVRRFRRTA